MAVDTKPNLSNSKFKQCSSDILNLSGCTNIFGKFEISSGATLSILPNRGLGKVLISDANGVGTWQINTSITGATNLGSGNGTIYTSTSANKLQLKTLSGGTNVTLTCNGNYIAINASASSGIGWSNLASGSTVAGCGTCATLNWCNTVYGVNALDAVTIGCNNVAIGYRALTMLTTGCGNIAIGYLAHSGGTNTGENIALGTCVLLKNSGTANMGMSFEALLNNTTGSGNFAAGFRALRANISGSENVSMLCQSLYNNSTGCYNIAIGCRSMYNFTAGCHNIALGYASSLGCANSTSTGNTSLGFRSHYCNYCGHRNIAIGTCALYTNSQGTDNIALGECAMVSVGGANTPLNNIALGRYSMFSITTGCNNFAAGNSALYSLTSACNNIAIGCQALSANTSGINNIANGYRALYCNTIGSSNIANGNSTLYYNTSGCYNIADGLQALYCNTSGNANIAIGSYTLFHNTTGCTNIANGYSALYCNTTGYYNIGVGKQALSCNTIGYYNVAVGHQAGFLNVTGSSSIYIGKCAGYSETCSNRLYISNCATKNLIYGEFDNEKLCVRGKLYISGLTNASKANAVFYDSSTKELTYAAAPSGSGGVTGATNLGTGNGTIYTSLSNNNIQLKTLSGGTNVTLTCNGNYIAINASASSGITTANNGLTKIGNNVVLGGVLTGDTCVGTIDSTLFTIGAGNPANFFGGRIDVSRCDSISYCNILNLGVRAGAGSKTTLSMLPTGITVFSNATDFQGVKYDSDYSSKFVARSLVDAAYVTGRTSGGVTGATNLGAGNGTIYTSINNKKLQLKTLSGGTNITLTCSDNYIGINVSSIGLAWSGVTANGVGTYVSATCIKSNPNMTFNGSALSVTGNINASTYVCSPTITGSTKICSPIVAGTTCVCTPILQASTSSCSPLHCGACGYFATRSCSPVHCGACGYFLTRVCSPVITGSTCICTPIVFASTRICSPIITGSTCICSPIVFGTTCLCGGIVCATTVVTAACTIGTTCVCSPVVLGSTCVCAGTLCAGTTSVSPTLKLTSVAAKSSETAIAYFKVDGTILSGTTSSSLSEYTITGNSSLTGFTINHAKNKQFVAVEVVKNSSPYPTIYTSVYRVNANCVCVTFDIAPVTGQQYKILITS